MGPVPDMDDERNDGLRDTNLIEDNYSNVILADSDSDTEDVLDGIVNEYQLLPMSDTLKDSDNDDDDDSEVEPDENNSLDNITESGSLDATGSVDVLHNNSTKLDQDRVEEIRAIMSNITLPVTNIPTWANAIPEDEWKAKLLLLAQKDDE